MRIMIDTNVLLSALIFKSAKLANLIEYITGRHTLVLCSTTIILLINIDGAPLNEGGFFVLFYFLGET